MSKSKKLSLGETAPLVTPIYQSSVYTIPDLDRARRHHGRR